MFARRLAPIGTAAIVILAAGSLQAGPTLAGNNQIDVTTTDDELNEDGDCSLREAVVAANTNVPVDACPAGVASTGIIDFSDRIRVPAGTYELAIAGTGEDAAATGDLDITDALTVSGESGDTIVDGRGLDRLFDVQPDVEASFDSLQLIFGVARPDDGGAIRFGEICDAPTTDQLASVQDSIVISNLAVNGGGIHIGDCRRGFIRSVTFDGNTAEGNGGALSVIGAADVEIENSTISGNVAEIAGGGIWASLNGGRVSTLYVTIAHQLSPDAAGIGMEGSTGDSMLQGTIIGDNDGPDCVGLVDVVTGASVTDDATCPMTRVGELHLDGLIYGTGHLPVHALRPGSPAIDVDPAPTCGSVLAFDQVGSPRPQDGNGDGIAACDAGAAEAAAMPAAGLSAPISAPVPNTTVEHGIIDRVPASIGGAILVALAVGGGVAFWRLRTRRSE